MRDCVHAFKPPSGGGPGSRHDVLDAIRLSTLSSPVCKAPVFSAGFSSAMDPLSCKASRSGDWRVEPLLPGAPESWSMAQVQATVTVEVFKYRSWGLGNSQQTLKKLS